jgi:hypothetical protein
LAPVQSTPVVTVPTLEIIESGRGQRMAGPPERTERPAVLKASGMLVDATLKPIWDKMVLYSDRGGTINDLHAALKARSFLLSRPTISNIWYGRWWTPDGYTILAKERAGELLLEITEIVDERRSDKNYAPATGASEGKVEAVTVKTPSPEAKLKAMQVQLEEQIMTRAMAREGKPFHLNDLAMPNLQYAVLAATVARLTSQKRLTLLRKGFYVTTPTEASATKTALEN